MEKINTAPSTGNVPAPRKGTCGSVRFYAIALAAIAFCVLYTAQPGHTAPGSSGPEAPWHIAADEISHDQTKDEYVAKGDVRISRLDRALTADFVRFNRTTMVARARGQVMMTAGDDVLTGSRMELDLNRETGTVYDGTVFIKANHFYLRGNRIEKTGDKTYRADKASATTCDGENPPWQITGRDLSVVIEGFGTVRHGTLWAGKVPVFYSPFLSFPVNRKRQTGLLTPEIGTSDRKGFEYNQPLFWAINDNSDATFYLHYMTDRGVKTGVEYRYVMDETSEGAVMFDFLDDRKVDDGSAGTTDWGYDGGPDRTNDDRYWFRMKHDQKLPYGLSLAVDLDVVSDQDYLREFKKGYSGFKDTNAYFERHFGRSLDDYTDSTRVNRLNLNRRFTAFNLNTEVRWYDDVTLRNSGDTDTTLQQLPSIQFAGIRQQVPGTPFMFDLDSEYTYFFRENTTATEVTAHRADLHPRFYLPLHYENMLSFEPSIGYRQTLWRVTGDDADGDDTFDRGLYDLRLDLSSDLFRVFDFDHFGFGKVLHAVRPQVVYEYIPEQEQGDLPEFDSIDSIERQNIVTYTLINTFTGKSFKKGNAPSDFTGKNSDAGPASYMQFCRFKLEQSYDFNEASENDSSKWRNGESREPFTPVYMELELTPVPFVSLLADAEWSTYDDRFRSHNIGLRLSNRRGDKAYIEHRYNRDPEDFDNEDDEEVLATESIYASFRTNLTRGFSAYGAYEGNIAQNDDFETVVGLVYQSQCWAVDLSYADEDEEQKVALVVSLTGLGALPSLSN